MLSVAEVFEQAVYYENRNQPAEAKVYYDFLSSYHDLSIRIIERAAQYYYGYGDYDQSIGYAERGILLGGNLDLFGEIVVNCFEHNETYFAAVNSLSKQADLILHPLLYFRVLRILFMKGSNVYYEAVSLNQMIEQQFLLNSAEYAPLYVETTLLLIELEWTKGNLPQSRFYLRKLLGLPYEYLSNTADIFAWAIQLDLFSELQTRKDFIRLKSQLSGAVKLFTEAVLHIDNKTLTWDVLNELKAFTFDQEFLQNKKILYLLYMKSLLDALTAKEIEVLPYFPNDWLAVKLYISHMGLEGYPYFQKHFTSHADLPEAVFFYNRIAAVQKEKPVTSLDDVSITVIGGGEKIGGTSILISVKDHHILLDAGIHLHEDFVYPDYSILKEKGVTFQDIDALLISHAHLDHTGAVPYVHQLNPDIPIYATEETKAIMRVLLRDLLKNNQADADFYTEASLQSALYHIQPMNKSFYIPSKGKSWKVTVYPAGHILGAVSIQLEMDGLSILFTGDFSVENQHTVKGLRLPEDINVDILITESTYGYLPSNTCLSRKEQEQELITQIEAVMERNGTLLIPAFAVGRSQEIVLILKNYFNNKPYLPFRVYLDGLVPEICKIYQQFSQSQLKDSLFFGGGILISSNFYQKNTFDEFYHQAIESGGNVIISSSGMLAEHSASARYAEKLLASPRNSIAFTGYLDEESPGFQLSKLKSAKEKKLTVNGKEKKVEAEIVNFRLSAHASREEIIQTILSLQPKKVVLVHGENEQSYKAPRSNRKAYFTLVDLLEPLPMEVIAAKNGTIYLMEEKG